MTVYWSYWKRGWWSLLMQTCVNILSGVVVLALTMMLIGTPYANYFYWTSFTVIFLSGIVPFTGWLFEVFAQGSRRIERSR